MSNWIGEYLQSRELAWSPTTLRSERYRLQALEKVLNGNPMDLWDELERRGTKPYTRATVFVRVIAYWDWCIRKGKEKGPNHYETFKEENARLFKNVYIKSKPGISFDNAKSLIGELHDPSTRKLALEILGSGTRYSESIQRGSESVLGKGSKRRDVFKPKIEGESYKRSYQTFRRSLQEIGLKPHDLRKLFLTRLVELGANEFELCQIAGWSKIDTASSYIKANSDRTRRLVESVQGVNKNESEQVS